MQLNIIFLRTAGLGLGARIAQSATKVKLMVSGQERTSPEILPRTACINQRA